MRNRSIALGCFLAALAPGTCIVAYALLSGSTGDDLTDLLGGAFVVLAISFAVAAAPTLLLGLPYVLWLRSRNALTWLNVCFGSAVAGALTMAVLTWAMVWNNPAPGKWAYLLGTGLGLAGGAAFCLAMKADHSPKPAPQA